MLSVISLTKNPIIEIGKAVIRVQSAGVQDDLGGLFNFWPDTTVPKAISTGLWGLRHLRYIREYCKALYISLWLSGELNRYLPNIGQQAEDMFSQLVKEMAAQEGISEQLKAENQMEWVDHMNNIQDRAKEIVCTELITG